jgi:ketosteroid isomerase-like protein
VAWAWIEALNKQDIDASTALVAEDAVLDRGPHGMVTGKEEIRATVLLEMGEYLRAEVSQSEVEGNTVTYYYEVFAGATQVGGGLSVATVVNGKIESDLRAE